MEMPIMSGSNLSAQASGNSPKKGENAAFFSKAPSLFTKVLDKTVRQNNFKDSVQQGEPPDRNESAGTTAPAVLSLLVPAGAMPPPVIPVLEQAIVQATAGEVVPTAEVVMTTDNRQALQERDFLPAQRTAEANALFSAMPELAGENHPPAAAGLSVYDTAGQMGRNQFFFNSQAQDAAVITAATSNAAASIAELPPVADFHAALSVSGGMPQGENVQPVYYEAQAASETPDAGVLGLPVSKQPADGDPNNQTVSIALDAAAAQKAAQRPLPTESVQAQPREAEKLTTKTAAKMAEAEEMAGQPLQIRPVQTPDPANEKMQQETVLLSGMEGPIKTGVTGGSHIQSAPHAPAHDPNNVIGQIVDKARLYMNQANSEMVIKLKPEHLGELMLKVTVENGVISAAFHSNSSEVRNIIEISLPQLKLELSQQGLKVENVGVYAGTEQFFANDQQSAPRQYYFQAEQKRTNTQIAEAVEAATGQPDPESVSGVDYRI